MRKNKLNLILLALFFLGNVSFALAQRHPIHNESYGKGKIEAAKDFKDEKFIFKTWGLISPTNSLWESTEEIYKRLLKEKYNITFESVGGCTVDSETVSYAIGYNEVLKAGIEAKYGTGFLDKIRKQAEEEYEVKYEEIEREYNRKLRERLNSLPEKPDN